jgi:hypothetical protein
VRDITQKSIKVQVAYYDGDEKAALLKYPTGAEIERIVQSPVEVGSEEFLTYYLFYNKRPGKPGYSSYDQLRDNIGRAQNELDGWIVFNDNSICSAPDAVPQDIHVTEKVGEAIGLAVVNRIHQLTAADWDRIPPIGGRRAPPIFDYQIASDGKNLVQIEAKGSCVDDNTLKTSTVSSHKANIKRKKTEILTEEKKHTYPYPSSFKYGTITVIDARPDSIAKCWLIDPTGDANFSARRLRLLNRVRFLLDWISFVSPRAQLTAALSTRYADLERMSDPFELDQIPLMRRTGQEFSTNQAHAFSWRTGLQTSFFANRPHVSDGPVGGGVVQITDRELFFFGFREDIVLMAMNQNFENILAYKAGSAILRKTVRCILVRRQYERLRLPEHIRRRARTAGQYMIFDITGRLHYSQEGLVFGILSTGTNV